MLSYSLRRRLFAIILVPLLIIATGAGIWRVGEAQRTAQELSDRSLLVTALAVSRDVAQRDGDAITPETTELLRAAAGGPVKYHVYAPDGVFVTGFASPPVPVEAGVDESEAFTYFDAVSRGRDVRVLRLQYVTQISGFTGPFKVTVWQDKVIRQDFMRGLAVRAFAVIAALIGTAAFVVWFGVKLGLKPLLDLEEAISKRGPDDLSPIQRRVPIEAQGLVSRLNRLFGQVAASMEAQSAFISDAAHQLRNPVAGLRALGESILTAGSLATAKARADDLVIAARATGDLAENLMTLERARAVTDPSMLRDVDCVDLVDGILNDLRPKLEARHVTVREHLPHDHVVAPADAIMLGEAIKNLIDNALVHGGPKLREIVVRLAVEPAHLRLTIADDGQGVAPENSEKIRSRFGQADTSDGSGLGLSIAEAVAKSHRGNLTIDKVTKGFSVSILLPRRRGD